MLRVHGLEDVTPDDFHECWRSSENSAPELVAGLRLRPLFPEGWADRMERCACRMGTQDGGPCGTQSLDPADVAVGANGNSAEGRPFCLADLGAGNEWDAANLHGISFA